MQGEIVQSMGLVLAINARRRGYRVPSWPDASIYCFCNRIEFMGRAPLVESDRQLSFPDPNAWLDHIQRGAGGAKLRVFTRGQPGISDRNSVGLAGGGPVVLVETQGSNRGAWWSAWSVTRQTGSDRRIWSVTYREAEPPTTPDSNSSSAQARTEFEGALADAIQFATSHNMGFDRLLTKARERLKSPQPLENFHASDVVPDGLMDLENSQLLASCSAAWVFGGMGSWNDVWFEGNDQKQ